MKANYGEAPCLKSDWFGGDELQQVFPIAPKGTQNRRGTNICAFDRSIC